VRLCGSVTEPPRFSHVGGADRYFTFPLEIERLSGTYDKINVIVREPLIEQLELTDDGRLCVEGELRSFNNKRGGGSRLVITVLALKLYFSDEEDCNSALLSGVICKTPTLRKTPMGRQICDLILAVNRRYGRSDYLPCIAWGRLAEELSARDVGDTVSLEGRVQSRKYIKTENGEQSERVAFEVSIVALTEE
jgi:primosomal replication protein N